MSHKGHHIDPLYSIADAVGGESYRIVNLRNRRSRSNALGAPAVLGLTAHGQSFRDRGVNVSEYRCAVGSLRHDREVEAAFQSARNTPASITVSHSDDMPKVQRIASVSEYVEWVEVAGDRFNQEENETLWFRGHGDASYRLIPSLYRSPEGVKENADDELRTEFERRALPMIADRPPRNEWEWYFVMQHYGAPTRLLDWTDSALVAFYFALTLWTKAPDGKPLRQPAVWALNPWTLTESLDLQPHA